MENQNQKAPANTQNNAPASAPQVGMSDLEKLKTVKTFMGGMLVGVLATAAVVIIKAKTGVDVNIPTNV